MVLWAIALPVIGSILTPEKPAYTGLIFVAGSFPRGLTFRRSRSAFGR